MAETLLASITRANPIEDENAPPSPRQVAGNASRDTARPAKREQVPSACQTCRRKKIKCDGARPCTHCATKHLICEYNTREGETPVRALKRKYDDVRQSNRNYAELFRILGQGSEREVNEIVRQIRQGRGAEAVVSSMSSGDAASFEPDARQLALESFLVSLAHSTGSLRDIIQLASSTLDRASNVHLPGPHVFFELRNRIVHLPHVEILVKRSKQLDVPSPLRPAEDASRDNSADLQSHRAVLDGPGDPHEHCQSNDRLPPHDLPAAPWTTVTHSDEAISHLVSVFLAWINPTWRFVEEDLFLLGMRSKRLDSAFCSPLLVNSICAIASLQSEHDIAFSKPDQDRITRGLHFHEEALRLWTLEECRPSITNMQALCILSLESNYRAKDRLGLTLVPIAAELNTRVPLNIDELRCAAQGVSRRDFTRVRLATHWTVVSTHVIMCIAFMNGATAKWARPNLPKIHDVFDDRIEYWTGYPLADVAIAHRPTLYLCERCRLIGLFQEMHEILFNTGSRPSLDTKEFVAAAERLSAAMEQWYQNLPFELHYEWPMSVAVWELHASYYAFSMTLALAVRTRMQQADGTPEDMTPHTDRDLQDNEFQSRTASEMLSRAIELARKAAQLLRDWRQQWGLKVTPAWMLQLLAVSAGVLLLDPQLAKPPTAFDSDEPTQDSRQAFEEVFRGLLGTAVEVMIARGIARMVYHTAQAQRITLSPSVKSSLTIMSATTWHPGDIARVNSTFPNFTTIKGHEDHERMTELLAKWEKMDI